MSHRRSAAAACLLILQILDLKVGKWPTSSLEEGDYYFEDFNYTVLEVAKRQCPICRQD